jgi:DNA polymerase-4
VSAAVFRIFEEFSPVVEPLSIDEAFIDLTGGEHLFGGGVPAARRLKERIRAEVELTASVGVAQCKYLAKVASDLNKPDGLTVLGPDEVESVLPKLPVTRLWGVGKVSAGRMETMGIHTIGDIRRRGMEWLTVIAGNDARRLWELCHGIDQREVVTDREAKSIGHEQTFEVDAADAQAVRDVLLELTEQVGFRLRRHGLHARGVSVKIRFGDFKTVTRSATLREASDLTTDLWLAARGLFDRWAKAFVPVRLIGITAERLQLAEAEEGLFVDQERVRQRRLDDVADRIKKRFGKGAIRRGGAD